MMISKILFILVFLCPILGGYCQLSTNDEDGVYIGKMIYTQKGNNAQYRIQFPIDFPVDFELDRSEDQVFYYFLQKRNFHYSELADTIQHFYNAIYLYKKDTFYSAINFFTRMELDTFSCDDPCHHCMHEAVTYKKNKWYVFTMNCNMNIWGKFKGYQIALVYDGYIFEGRRNKIIFLSKILH